MHGCHRILQPWSPVQLHICNMQYINKIIKHARQLCQLSTSFASSTYISSFIMTLNKFEVWYSALVVSIRVYEPTNSAAKTLYLFLCLVRNDSIFFGAKLIFHLFFFKENLRFGLYVDPMGTAALVYFTNQIKYIRFRSGKNGFYSNVQQLRNASDLFFALIMFSVLFFIDNILFSQLTVSVAEQSHVELPRSGSGFYFWAGRNVCMNPYKIHLYIHLIIYNLI